MTIKSAAFFALIGTALLTILLAAGFIIDVVGLAQGVTPAMSLLTSFIHAFAALSMAVFFYAFHRGQA